jgi:hypothetical protein
MYRGLDVKYPLSFSDVNEKNYFDRFLKIYPIS